VAPASASGENLLYFDPEREPTTFGHYHGAGGALSADERYCGFRPATAGNGVHHRVELRGAAAQIPTSASTSAICCASGAPSRATASCAVTFLDRAPWWRSWFFGIMV
jgi:hypothetical protein